MSVSVILDLNKPSLYFLVEIYILIKSFHGTAFFWENQMCLMWKTIITHSLSQINIHVCVFVFFFFSSASHF